MIAPASPSASALVGSVLGGRYDVVRLLGRGGMGEVYEGTHRLLQKRVAIKVLSPQLAVDETQRLRFLREARAANLIAHDNVVSILDFGDGDPTYFVMEFLQGDDLHRLVAREGGLRWPRAQGLLLQMTRAFAAAHARGIVHRDVKPSNIFVLPRSGQAELVKVLDFGIAKVAGNGGETLGLTRTHELMGTVAYMAPEQALGERVDARTDIYALGIVIYEMLSGKLPFNGTNSYKVLDQHVRTPPPRPTFVDPSIPPAVEALILRALAKDPADRFASMEELGEAIASIGCTAGATPSIATQDRAEPGTVMLARASVPSCAPTPPTELLAVPATPACAGPTEFLARELPSPAPAVAVAPNPATHAGPPTQLGSATAMTRFHVAPRRRILPWLVGAAVVAIGLGVVAGTQLIDDAPATDTGERHVAAAASVPTTVDPVASPPLDAPAVGPTQPRLGPKPIAAPQPETVADDTPEIVEAASTAVADVQPPATDDAEVRPIAPATKRSRSRATLGGTPPVATFDRTVAALQKSARRKCAAELGRNGVTVTFHIKTDGTTALVKVTGSTALDDAGGCVAALVRAANFYDGRDAGRHSIVLEP